MKKILELLEQLIQFTYATGYYAGAMEHGKFTQEKDNEYAQLLKDDIQKRQRIKYQLINLLEKGE